MDAGRARVTSDVQAVRHHDPMDDHPNLRVMALHALVYCERLYYLEEVEEIRVADAAVFAGRTLHESLEEEGPLVRFELESDGLGLRGKVDAVRRRDGVLIPYEHKRGRSRRDPMGAPTAWPSDEVQVAAYAMLLEDARGEAIAEGRVRYHQDNTVVRVAVDEALRGRVRDAVSRARALNATAQRPPVTIEENKCTRCSLAPVCLPEEARQARHDDHVARRMFPRDDDRMSLHVSGHGARVGRSGHQLVVEPRDGLPSRYPIEGVRSVVVHGYSTVSSQALGLCSSHDVAVHWLGPGGRFVGSFYNDDGAVQRRIRQYDALRVPAVRQDLARRLVSAKLELQLRFVLRATRGTDRDATGVAPAIGRLREALSAVAHAESPEALLGHEGSGAAAYFAAWPALLAADADPLLRPHGRSRRPPRDGCNALLSFGYALLLREVVQAIRVVGLDAAFGLYHRPRSSAPPLALDLMEIFRVTCVDMAVIAAINRSTFDARTDFTRAGEHVWLSDAGRAKAIEVFERRLHEELRHPVLDYALSYRRHIELEVRLLEKEWSGEPGLFARTRIR